MPEFQILNGDALLDQFLETIPGDRIVMRECMVQGNVEGNSLDEILVSRKAFMQSDFGVSEKEYTDDSEAEILKIKNISDGIVNLWFEEDLFCQVNLWFSCYLLAEKLSNLKKDRFILNTRKTFH